MKAYDHSKIEKKWQKEWAKNKIYTTPDTAPGKDNFYLLVEFPYPSGNLHVGHWYAFAVPDILARYQRMQGKNVLYPIGFDAFGLPAENAAIKNKLNPRDWTEKNIAHMTKQIESMGTSFDWSRKVSTIDPNYYAWTQWLFLELYKKGLVYQKETAVNWCPKDKTVLANEQVVNGKCERCGTEVIQKLMLQWNIKITDYADRLIDDLTPLDWPEQIKESQRNWIGRSEGAEIDFGLDLGKKYTFVILHGYKSRPDRPRWLWVKSELEKLGHAVIVPALPHPDTPSESEQVAEAVAAANYDENTVLVGHSLGAVVAMKTLLKLNKKIARLVLIANAIDPTFEGAEKRPFHETFDWDINYKKIQELAPNRLVLSDLKEPPVRIAYLKHLASLLDAQLVETQAEKEHFTGDKEPDVLMWLRPTIRVFTTRPDTLFGATYLVLAPEHPWVTLALQHKTVLKNNDEVAAYVKAASKKTELERQTDQKEKTGVRLEGVMAINPATEEQIPLYVADYVLAHYGTGAIMSVPAHDERDHAFAQKFELPIKVVVQAPAGEDIYTGEGPLIDSGEYSGTPSNEARKLMAEKFGRLKKTYRLRDWIVSRQRYWGVPIPIIHCQTCGAQPVPVKDLPVELPPVEDYLPDGNGKSPLAKVKEFVETKCPQCGSKASRETDTLDTFVDSSWYFLRYVDPQNNKAFASKAKLAKWMPVDLYSGGAEHTTMHLLYSRFWHKALYDMELVPDAEPYARRMNRSIILGPDGQKMSKSHGNVIDPDEVVERLGADTVRMYLAFVGPYSEVSAFPWNPDGVVGVRRFLERVWRLQEKVSGAGALSPLMHKTIKKTGEDIAAMKFNTAISQLMILLNELEKRSALSQEEWATFLTMLAPFAPHTAEELWSEIGHKKSIHLEAWPSYDEKMLVDEEVTYGIQIDGKTRGEVKMPADADKSAVEAAAREAVASRLEGKEVARVIVVPKRLVNFVMKS
jgi:leucyl-tRNA synthetase